MRSVGEDKSYADDLSMKRGIVSSRVALLLRSAEIKPLFIRFVVTTQHFPRHPAFLSTAHLEKLINIAYQDCLSMSSSCATLVTGSYYPCTVVAATPAVSALLLSSCSCVPEYGPLESLGSFYSLSFPM